MILVISKYTVAAQQENCFITLDNLKQIKQDSIRLVVCMYICLSHILHVFIQLQLFKIYLKVSASDPHMNVAKTQHSFLQQTSSFINEDSFSQPHPTQAGWDGINLHSLSFAVKLVIPSFPVIFPDKLCTGITETFHISEAGFG